MATDVATINQVLQIIKNDPVKQDHFFRKLAAAANPIPWLLPVAKDGYLQPTNNPSPEPAEGQPGSYRIPIWNVLSFLENVAQAAARESDDSAFKTLIDWVNQIIAYRDTSGSRVDNYHTDATVVKILFALPPHLLVTQHLDFVETVLKSSTWGVRLVERELFETAFPRLIATNQAAYLCRLLEIVLEYRKSDRLGSREYEAIIEDYELRRIHAFTSSIFGVCGPAVPNVVLAKMRRIVDEDKSQFNNIWIPAIEDHEQNKFPERYECQLVRLLRDLLLLESDTELSEHLRLLLSYEHPIFVRIALHVIDRRYVMFGDLMWTNVGRYFDNSLLKHELYELFRNHSASFSDQQVTTVLSLIETIRFPGEGEAGERERYGRWVAYVRKEWLSAFLPSKRKEVNDLYEKYNRIDPAPLDHPGMTHWMEEWHGDSSPIDPASLAQMSTHEIAGYLNAFQETGQWEAPSVDGLSSTLRECVRTNSLKFCADLKVFVNTKGTYQHAILAGLRDAWKSDGEVLWNSVVDYTRTIIASDTFWSRESDNRRFNTRNWVISEIAGLFEAGAGDKQRDVGTDLIESLVDIQIECLKHQRSDLSSRSDLITAVINSVRGKLFRSLIVCSLAWARHQPKDSRGRWLSAVKEDFSRRLDNDSELSPEYPVILGSHLPNLLYLDQQWVWDNFEKIFDRTNEEWWKASISGYFFYSQRLYVDIYRRMVDGSHLTKVLGTEFSDSHVVEKVVQHVCLSYLNRNEGLDNTDSMIARLVTSGIPEHLRTTIQFYWGLRDDINDNNREQIIRLWAALHERLTRGGISDESKSLLSDLSKWLRLLDTIDDETQGWLEECAKYVEINFNSAFFIEYLLYHVKKTPERVAKIYIAMLEAGQFPDYDKKHIIETVRMLGQSGHDDAAIEICNLYNQHGLEFLNQVLRAIHLSRSDKPK